MAANLLQNGDYNVITTHWIGYGQLKFYIFIVNFLSVCFLISNSGSKYDYIQAAGNTRLVALEIAHLVNVLKVSFSIYDFKITSNDYVYPLLCGRLNLKWFQEMCI